MSATEIISEGPEGIILESVLEGYAEYYSADLSEKVIRGMTENALLPLKSTKIKVQLCTTLQNMEIADKKVVAIFELKEISENAIL